MNHGTTRPPLPSPVGHVLTDGGHYIDNLFANAWKTLNLNRRLESAGFAKRSGIEVTETRTFASHTASIHLCAIRYLVLVHAKLSDDRACIGQLRADIQDPLNLMSFAGRLWQIFRATISDTLDELGDALGCSVETLLKAFDEKVNQFFVQSLQLDAFTMRLEYE